MMSFFLLLLSCRSTGELHTEPAAAAPAPAVEPATAPPTPAPPRRVPPPCDNLDGALIPALSGDTRGLDVTAAGVQVTVEARADSVLPAGFVEELRAGGLIQGRMPAADLCVLATTPGVADVRPPILATPKEN